MILSREIISKIDWKFCLMENRVRRCHTEMGLVTQIKIQKGLRRRVKIRIVISNRSQKGWRVSFICKHNTVWVTTNLDWNLPSCELKTIRRDAFQNPLNSKFWICCTEKLLNEIPSYMQRSFSIINQPTWTEQRCMFSDLLWNCKFCIKLVCIEFHQRGEQKDWTLFTLINSISLMIV
jgi:hypothetical protein